MSLEYYFNCVGSYLSHVLAKFLLVGRGVCTKTSAMSTIWIVRNQFQSHEYKFDCAQITNQRHEYHLKYAFFTNQSCVYYLDHLFYSAPKSKQKFQRNGVKTLIVDVWTSILPYQHPSRIPHCLLAGMWLHQQWLNCMCSHYTS